MNKYLLELHREQLEKAFYRISTIRLYDKRLDALRGAIGYLCNILQMVDFNIEDENELYSYRDAISLLQEWIGWIANQEHGTKPHAVISCIDIAAHEWLGDDSERFVFVATDGQFGIYADDPNVELVLEWIYNKFKVFVPYRLVHIQIPFHLDDDYLFNVVLYHELGHFIDRQLKVTAGMAGDIISDWTKNTKGYCIAENAKWENDLFRFNRQLSEIFADLFAAQYAGECIVEYLKFHGDDTFNTDSGSHPSPSLRVALIEDFRIQTVNNYLINTINSTLNGICGKTLSARPWQSGLIITNTQYTFAPAENVYQVFPAAWESYYHHRNNDESISESYQKVCRAAEAVIISSISK